MVVGHSLGAVVALELVTLLPDYARGVLLEDPPALRGDRASDDIAEEIGREVIRARTDPHQAIAAILAGHPGWTRRDARSVLEGRLQTDPVLAGLSPGVITWNLTTLVSASPVPVAVVAATGTDSALLEPDRSELRRLLPRRTADRARREPPRAPRRPGRAGSTRASTGSAASARLASDGLSTRALSSSELMAPRAPRGSGDPRNLDSTQAGAVPASMRAVGHHPARWTRRDRVAGRPGAPAGAHRGAGAGQCRGLQQHRSVDPGGLLRCVGRLGSEGGLARSARLPTHPGG